MRKPAVIYVLAFHTQGMWLEKDTLAWLDGVSPHLPRFLSKVGRDSVEPNSREAETVYLRSVLSKDPSPLKGRA